MKNNIDIPKIIDTINVPKIIYETTPLLSTKLLLTILLNVLLIATFIIFFYFTIGIKIETTLIDNQMSFLSDNLYDNVTLLGPDAYNSFKNTINTIDITNDTNLNTLIDQQNQDIKNKGIKVYSVFASIVVLFLGALFYLHKNDINYKSILKNNILLIIFIMIIYTIFLSFFSSKYLSVDPNKIKLTLLNNMKQYNLI